MTLLLIIDGDPLAHLACRYDRWQAKCKREDDKLLVNIGEDGTKEHLEYTKEENRKYMEESWDNFLKLVESLQEKFYTNDYLMAVKGDGNFRMEIFPEYKANRRRAAIARPDNRRTFVDAVTQLSVEEGMSEPAHGREADDLVRIWAENAIREKRDFIVCTIDKDLKCIPGRFYDPKKKEMFDISEEEAKRHYYEQILQGDQSDGIPGVPGMGPITAQKSLEGCVTDEDYQETIAGHYIAAYDKEWVEMLTLNGRLIHIQKTLDDVFSVEDWAIVQELER